MVAAAIEDNLDAGEVVGLEHLVGGLKAPHIDLGARVELLRGPGNHRPQATTAEENETNNRKGKRNEPQT